MNAFNSTRLKGRYKPDYALEDRGFDTPCWIWQKSIKASGHGQVAVAGSPMLAHRHYYELEKGPIPKRAQVVQKCGVRACVNPDHLEVISMKERNRRSALTKLDKRQVKKIRREAENTGYNEKLRIAEKYGISWQHLYAILRGSNWAD